MWPKLWLILALCGVLAGLVPGSAAAVAPSGSGKIVVNHDEWTLSGTGFSQQPVDAARFAQNLANWFAEDGSGSFLIYSTNFGLAQAPFINTLTAAGHSVTISTGVPFTVATLMAYDAVFLAGDPASNTVLTDYVNAGGGVYIALGTGWGGEQTMWSNFLANFGLAYGWPYNGIGGNLPSGAPHPVLTGVQNLYYNNGNTLSLTPSAGPETQILLTHNGSGLMAVYEAACDPTLTWAAPLDASPASLPAGDTLPIAFRYGTCADFMRDESVIVVVQDLANPDYPVTAHVYGSDITIDNVAELYELDFVSGLYGLSPGTQLAIHVYIGYEPVGTAYVNITP